ncbi:histamine N-methyltransferase-like [Amphiura filiformis]|uniref:histamine N-methyltransferase-like n=1 Tax=Amphiura filiformis TaxID=82378 RepID=UPI003B223BBA
MASPISHQRKLPHSIILNLDDYWSGIDGFCQHSNRDEVISKWIEDNFESYVVSTLSERLGEQPLRVLGVGTGEGYFEVLQMKKLKSNFSEISATVNEPSTKHIIQYQDAVDVEKQKGDLGEVHYEWHNQSFQDYMKSTGAKQKYHFISILHAIYYVGEVEKAVTNLYELLEPSGMIFIMIITEHTGVGKLLKTFPQVALDETTRTSASTSRTSKSSVASTPTYVHAFNSSDIKAALSKNRIAYTQPTGYAAFCDVTPCFTQKDSLVAKEILDTITFTVNFKESVPDEVFSQVMGFLQNNTRVVKSDQGGDKFYFDSEVDVILISK